VDANINRRTNYLYNYLQNGYEILQNKIM